MARPRLASSIWLLLGVSLVGAVVLVACSAGPASLSSVVGDADLETYQGYLRRQDSDARAAYLAWRSEETGRPVDQLAAEDAALSETRNPFNSNDPWAVSRGGLIYQVHCASCHGAAADGLGEDGQPLMGAKDFHHPHTRMAARLSDGYLADWYEKISNGTVAKESPEGRALGVMPAMKDALTREQIWLAVTYLTSNELPIKEVSR